jgi:DNA-binding beta-propeller fold protein YncE
MKRHFLLALAATASLTTTAAGRFADPQFLISANDGKATVIDGVQQVPATVSPDTISIFDMSLKPPKLVAELRAPTSVVGPPESVAIALDQSIALVTGALKLDPADRTKTIPDDTVTVIDLAAVPPVVLTTLHAGRQASGVSINRAGTLALVANRGEGSVSVFSINKKQVTAAGKIDLGAPESGPSHVAITPDGRTALVSRNNDHLVSVLSIQNNTVTYTKRDIASGLKPYGIEITPAGDVALVANVGAGPSGGSDTISVIDLKLTPPRAVDQIAAGPTVEGISLSPDGRFVAVTVMNGSNLSKASGLANDFGFVKVYSVKGTTVAPVASAQVGRWCQGAAWTPDAHTVFVQCMVEKEIQMFDFDGRALKPAGALKVAGGPAGIRTAR